MGTKRYAVVVLVVMAVATGWWLYTTCPTGTSACWTRGRRTWRQRAEERVATATAVEPATATAEARATVTAGTSSREPRATAVSRTQRRESSGTEQAVDRWREATEHWEVLDAFRESMRTVNADRVIDLAESKDLCYKSPQWREQLKAARDYVVAYREVEPSLVDTTPRLHKLETEATEGLRIVAALEEECQ